MDLTLTHVSKTPAGIFGLLVSPDSSLVACTLEHAYDSGDGNWAAKVPPGTYMCTVGDHPKQGHVYEVTHVPGHTDILIHAGNFDKDSEGCILVGAARTSDMITNSRETLARLMALQADQPFQLTVGD